MVDGLQLLPQCRRVWEACAVRRGRSAGADALGSSFGVLAAVKKALMSMTYDGLWKIRFDDKGEAIFNFDVVRLKKGGALEVQHINPN